MPLVVIWVIAVLLAPQPAVSQAPASLDFDYFKTRVQPIFLAKRPGHARCYSCHSQGTPMRLQELSAGSAAWNDEQSRKNFEVVRKFVVPSAPLKSPLLYHPLEMDAGGDLFHNGGKHWQSQGDQEFQTLLAWVKGQTVGGSR
jgi:hypothetical protein